MTDSGGPPDPAILDLRPITEAFGEINDDARELLGSFIEIMEEMLVEIDGAFAEDRIADAREVVHRAHGAANNAGGIEMAALLNDMEKALIDKQVDTARDLGTDLPQLWSRLKSAVLAV